MNFLVKLFNVQVSILKNLFQPQQNCIPDNLPILCNCRYSIDYTEFLIDENKKHVYYYNFSVLMIYTFGLSTFLFSVLYLSTMFKKNLKSKVITKEIGTETDCQLEPVSKLLNDIKIVTEKICNNDTSNLDEPEMFIRKRKRFNHDDWTDVDLNN